LEGKIDAAKEKEEILKEIEYNQGFFEFSDEKNFPMKSL